MEQPIIHLKFNEPIDGKTDYFFGSLSAIFSKFTPPQVGCTLRDLFEARVATTGRYVTTKCIIKRAELIRQTRKN